MGHLMRGELAEARAALEAGLVINPQSSWIREGMMPWLEEVEAQAGADAGAQ
jgi:hypothetical protein